MYNFVIFGILVLSSFISATSPTYFNFDDGQPGCTTQDELNERVFQNFWDPTAYWTCHKLHVPADMMRCQDGTAFQSSLKKCISWAEWQWEAPVFPLGIDPVPTNAEQAHNDESQIIGEMPIDGDNFYDHYLPDEEINLADMDKKNMPISLELNETK